MQFYNIIIHLHPSISSKIHTLVGKIDEETSILKGIISIISTEKEISKILISEDNIKFGYLILSDKIELRTTKKIYSKVSNDIEVRIIPISHGG